MVNECTIAVLAEYASKLRVYCFTDENDSEVRQHSAFACTY